jgi:ATP synthase protein I
VRIGRRAPVKRPVPLVSTQSFESRMPSTQFFGVPAAADKVGPASGTDSALPERDREMSDVAWSVVSYLIAGMLLWGGLGWLVDRWLDRSTALFFPLGLVLGIGAALYLVFARIDRSPPTGP